MCGEIKVGNFIAIQDDKGDWIYKAQESKALKKDGTLKAEYKEMPRFKILTEMENEVQDEYSQSLTLAINQVKNKIKTTKLY